MTMKGEISNLQNSYILASYLSSDTLALDTIPVDKKGRFHYQSNIDTLTVFTLYFNDFNSSATVFADRNDKIKLHGDALFPDLIEVNGNSINDDLTLFKEKNESLLKRRGQLYQNMGVQNSVLSDSGGNILSNTERIAMVNSLNHELMAKAEEYIQEHPSQMSSLILINDFFGNSENPAALERVLGYVSGDISKSPMTLGLKAYSEKINRSAEGVHMPYFELKDKNDKEVKSGDFLGKYVLLSFVSALGEESRQSIKILKDGYRKFDKKFSKDSVRFISVFIDSDIYPVTYLETDSISWLVVPEKKSWASEIVDTYNIQFVPYNILITPDGIIKDRNIPSQEVNDAITKQGSKIISKK